ncbi:MAG: hypothetical protein VXW43_17505, partial [Pseudomonadota bacterium]|nr:hypothetical protein [Pseudomonadota bacterium]
PRDLSSSPTVHFHLYLFDHNAADDGLIGTANADAGRTTAMNASSHRAATRAGHPEQRQRRRGAAAALASSSCFRASMATSAS